jgi:alkanesulfonate monooxygenase SsuD/methylene tetrahydromethanopterin reductase-like flavin-dependent oxidoreductase (luciferase family)
MRISIGLPSTIPGATGKLLLDWARKADQGPFHSLATLDRLTYPNFDPLVTLTAAAAVTERIRLMTFILVAPLHNPVLLAKQAASLDALSGGRLTLGLGVGARDYEFRAASVDFQTRGKRFDHQLDLMARVWRGEPVGAEGGLVGPTPI